MTTENQATEIKNMGKVRGSQNTYARLHLHLHMGFETAEEISAFSNKCFESIGLTCCGWSGAAFQINSREEFALIPFLIRKAQALDGDVTISQWDVGVKGEVSLDKNPEEFWKQVALSQMFVGD